ncbi:MAG: tetratricopeptide repeat protein, partial [Isosphaeraceae bacterium]
TWNTLGLAQADLKDADKARAALASSRDHFRRLADDHPGRPEYRRGLARSLFNLGNLLFRDGAPGAEAASLYRQGIAIHRSLQQPPDDFKYRRDLGRALLNLGSFAIVDGGFEEAAVHLHQAQDLFRTLSGEFPGVPDLQGSLALSLGKAGDLARARGDFPGAVASYDLALAQYEALIANHSNVARYRREQAQFLNNLGLARIDADKPGEARIAFTQALGIYADEYARTKQPGYLPLMASTRVNRATLRGPDAAADYDDAVASYRTLIASQESPALRESLAIALYNQGRFRSLEGLPDPEGPLDEAIGRLTKIVESRPESSVAQSTLGNALERRARIVQEAEPDRALGLLQSALYHQQQAVAQSPRERLYRLSLLDHYEALARLQQRRGDLGTAAALADTLAQVDPGSAAAKLRAARILAGLSAGGDGASGGDADRAARAVAMLAEALAKGGIDRAKLANDPDFAPIAGREDFQALLNPPKSADGP